MYYLFYDLIMAPVHLNTGSHADSFAFTPHAQSPSGNSINFTFKIHPESNSFLPSPLLPSWSKAQSLLVHVTVTAS